MKKLICIVKPFKLNSVLETLCQFPVDNVLVTEVRGYGRQKGHLELYAGSEYKIHYLPKIKLEFTVSDEWLETLTRELCATAKTGRIGDGKIFIFDIAPAAV